jgi:hypothetical protein
VLGAAPNWQTALLLIAKPLTIFHQKRGLEPGKRAAVSVTARRSIAAVSTAADDSIIVPMKTRTATNQQRFRACFENGARLCRRPAAAPDRQDRREFKPLIDADER